MIKTKGAQAYKNQVAIGAEGAKPEELVGLLFTRLLETLAKARQFMEMKNFAEKASRINHAIEIITTLEQALDHEQGGELSGNLQALYQDSTKQLLTAHTNNDVVLLDEVVSLMREIHEGWQGMLAGKTVPPQK